jgi:hypothetical protein
MSIIGPRSLPALGLAASAAAAQQRAAGLADRDKADQAQQKMAADQVRLANRDLDDSVETDFSHGQVSDRDSDGRLPWQRPEASATGEDEIDEKDAKPRAVDPEADCGRALDVDA